MASSSPRHIAMTGASAGIGAQLALAYAAPGVRLALAARRGEALNAVAEACRARGAEVHCATLDVRDCDAVQAWIDNADAQLVLDLVIANAGIFDGHGAGGVLETGVEIRHLVETNVIGAINTAQASIGVMRARKRGHIALVSSLAAILPAADAPVYSASKAAVAAYGEAIRLLLAGDGVCVSVIMPGHVETAQTRIHIGNLAMMISAEAAARTIKRGLDARRTHIAFPATAHWLVRIARMLPWRITARLTAGDRFHVRKKA